MEKFLKKNSNITIPKKFIGNQKSIEKLRKAIKEHNPCIIYGPAGIGKTTAVYMIASELGYRVIETNASDSRKKDDLYNIYQSIRTYGFSKCLYLFDEADSMNSSTMMVDIIKSSFHPIILTANDIYKVKKSIRNICMEIRFYNPRIQEVAWLVKDLKEYGDYSNISNDIRQAISIVKYGSHGYDIITDFDIVDRVFNNKDVSHLTEPSQYIWLIDNVCNYYSGYNLYKVISFIRLACLYNNPAILSQIPKGHGRPTYPYFFKRLKTMKENKK